MQDLCREPKLPEDWLIAAESSFGSRNYQRCVIEAQHATVLAHDSVAAWQVLGDALHQLGRLSEAATAYETALTGAPNLFDVLNNLGAIKLAQGRLSEAYRFYRRAVVAAPGNAIVRNNLGVVLRRLSYPTKAVACFAEAIKLDSGYAKAHRNLGNVLQDMGDFRGAMASYRRSLEIAPDVADAYSAMLFCLTHDEQASPNEVFDAHRAFARQFEETLVVKRQAYRNTPVSERRIRLGFVSADLCQHPVANFIGPIWHHFDRGEFEITAYANQHTNDAATSLLKARVDRWRNVSVLDDDALATQIRGDGIDILFDLSGHTAGNRLLVFARKPAPIQIAWIGYPNSTGLSSIDYRLVDEFVAPRGLFDNQFSEKLLYLPSAGTFENIDDALDVNALPASATGTLTFASFHRGNKIGGGVIALWSRVLNAVPEARMLIGACGETAVQNRLIQRFAEHGVERDRLRFRPKVGMADYLTMHHEVDIHLDSFPFTSGTTANHALWMGVPTLTLAGATMPQRLSAAHLGRVGLHQWIAQTPDDYVAKAEYWANHLDELAALRATLRTQITHSPLRHAGTVTRGLETVLRQVWRQWCENNQLSIPADAERENAP